MAAMKLLLALALFVAIASAARMPDLAVIEEDLPDSVVAFQGGAGLQEHDADSQTPIEFEGGFSMGSLSTDLESVLTEAEVNDKSKWPIRIATKYLVKPDLHGNFVHQFWRFQYKSEKQKGLLHLSLSKVAGDNIVWTSYVVFEDFEALIQHARSEALRDFASYLTNVNIAVKTNLLFRVAGGYHGHKKESNALATADNKKKSWPVRLLTAYIVRPGEHCGFVKAWEKLEKKIGGSKGNIALSLSKPLGNNIVFVSYAAWESPRDLWEAGKSKAVKEFLEYVADNHITEVTKKLWKVPAPKW